MPAVDLREARLPLSLQRVIALLEKPLPRLGDHFLDLDARRDQPRHRRPHLSRLEVRADRLFHARVQDFHRHRRSVRELRPVNLSHRRGGHRSSVHRREQHRRAFAELRAHNPLDLRKRRRLRLPLKHRKQLTRLGRQQRHVDVAQDLSELHRGPLQLAEGEHQPLNRLGIEPLARCEAPEQLIRSRANRRGRRPANSPKRGRRNRNPAPPQNPLEEPLLPFAVVRIRHVLRFRVTLPIVP
jgi:hypothetical protein